MATIKPVAQWTTYEDALHAVQQDLPRDFEVCRKIIEDHDHWLSGDGWIGHRTGDAVVDAALRARVEPQFVADDVAGELVENRTNGLIGQEADIQLEPLEEPEDETQAEALQDEAEQILGDLATWWDRKKLWEKVAEASDRVSYARRGAVTPFIADGNTTPGSIDGRPTRLLPTGKTRAEAFDLIDLDAPASNMATRYVDPTTQRAHAIVLTKINDQDRVHVWSVNPESKKTEVRVFVKGGGTPAGVAVDLGGRLPMGEMRGKRLITPPLRKLQQLLNFIMTVTGRAVETGGYRSVHVTNAEPHLLWLTTKPTSTPVEKTLKDEHGQDVLWGVRTPPIFGAGILSEWQGIELNRESPTTPQTIATPGVTALDPVDTAYATNAAKEIRRALYGRGKQGHLANEATAESSGVAYQQARAQHEADLKRLKSPCEGMIRDVIESALALAGQMSAEAAGILQRFRVVVTLHISAGPVTPEDARLAVELRNQRAISQQTMMARVGVEDPDAEQGAIDADPVVRADFWQKMTAAISVLTTIAGMTPEGAGFLLGLSPEQVEVLRTGQPPKLSAGGEPERKLEIAS